MSVVRLLLFAVFNALALASGTTAHGRAAVPLDTWLETTLRFVEWPTGGAWVAPTFAICHPAGELQRSKLAGKTVRGTPIELIAVSKPSQTGPCRVFFTQSTDAQAQEDWLISLRDRPVLTIGLSPEFCMRGAIVCPPRADFAGAHFAVNYAVASRLGLRVSSHLPAHDTSAYTLARKKAQP